MTKARWRMALPAYGAAAIGLAAGIWLLVAVILGFAIWQERGREVERAKLAAAATTALMEAHTASTFQVVDLALQEVARRVELLAPARHDAELRALMAERAAGMPYVRAIFVIGPDGYIQHDSEHPKTPDVSLADRDYFRAHRDDPSLARSISGPILSRSGTGWFVAASRRIGDGARFRGIAVAAIQLSYFSDLYQRMGLGAGHRIVLFHRDGRLVAQYPQDSAVIGSTFADFPLFRQHLPKSRRGVYVSTGAPLPYQRIFSYEALQSEPLVVALAHDMDAVLAAWRKTAAAAATVLLVLLLGLAAAVGQFLRHQRHRQQLRDRIAQGEKLEALGQLTGSIAHDFANLLGIISTNLELLQRLAGADARAQPAVARAQRAVASGTQMTRQLMSFARKRELEVVDADLDEALAAVLPLLEQAAGEGVRITLERSSGLPRCRLDRTQFEVALINLVVNARDAMQRRGQLVLRTRKAPAPAGELPWSGAGERFVCLAVTDDGPGMSEDVRRRALEPFFTTKGEAGTGLGLAQVYGFMRQLGGDVAIDSRPGAGTTVELCFPALEP